jgi:hypothetical protein
MRFIIDYSRDPEEKDLVYYLDEYSFDMKPWVNFMDIELAINKLTLTVLDNQIIQLSGFCSLPKLMNSNICTPDYSKGRLMIEHNQKPGFTFRIYEEDQPVYLNNKSGWVCIGDPSKEGNAVEFIKNCLAVVDSDGNLKSLWLKPRWG